MREAGQWTGHCRSDSPVLSSRYREAPLRPHTGCMTEILIDVEGRALTYADPERAIVQATVTADGPEPQPVKDWVSLGLVRIRASLEELHRSGAVERFAVDQVRISAHRPWNDQGTQLPLVHTASVSLTAHFVDFAALGRWVLTEGLTVQYINWDLTDASRVALERRTRQAAVRDAVTRAQDYADALDLGQVEVRTIRDPQVSPRPEVMRAAAAQFDGGGGGFDLSPEPIEIRAAIHAGFTVTRP